MVDGIQKHFSEHDFGLWAIEVGGIAPFIGFAGLSIARFSAPFTPCVEVGWRLAFEHWGHGYATEAARLALDYGFGILALSEVVSYTSATNHRSRAVMEGDPPCLRHRLRPWTAGDWHGAPARVLAPHRGARRRLTSLVSMLWCMGLISKFRSSPGGQTVATVVHVYTLDPDG
jgi:hypothetical protein